MLYSAVESAIVKRNVIPSILVWYNVVTLSVLLSLHFEIQTYMNFFSLMMQSQKGQREYYLVSTIR